MPLSALDPQAALVVIDLQRGIAPTPMAHPHETVVAHSAELAAAFRARGLPVVLVNATGVAPGRSEVARSTAAITRADDWAELLPELGPAPDDILISKQTWGAFHRTALDEELRRRGVTQVILTGVATSAGVESTARAAHEHGYHVVLVTDAMSDRSLEAHDASVRHIFPRLGETTTTRELLGFLQACPTAQ